MSKPTPPPTVTPSPRHTTDYVTAWEAPSRTHSHVTYVVTYDRLYNEWACQCPAYTYRGTCAHVDACITAQVAQWREARKAVA